MQARILADPANRALHVQALMEIARQYDGIDLDYEGFAYSDDYSSWESTAPRVLFVEELAAALHAEQKLLVVTIPPVYNNGESDSGTWVYDPKAIGKVADYVRFMAYDYSTSSPGPIAPIDWVRRLTKAAKS